MKKVIFFLATVISLESCRKTEACLEVSNENPKVNEFINVSAACSEKAKWIEVEIDGSMIKRGFDDTDFQHSFTTSGSHVITLTVYRSWTGSYNSNSGCSGCKGSGKSSSVSKTLTVTK